MTLQVARINGTHIHYRQSGPWAPDRCGKGCGNGADASANANADAAPILVFANSLGTDFRIWDDVVPVFARTFNILTYDKRGHGLSGLGDAPYSIELHARDLIGLLDHVGAKRVILCGLSVGGQIALQIAAMAPERLRGLILCDTAPKLGDADAWNARIDAIRSGGIAAMADMIIERWLSPGYRQTRPVETAMYRDMLLRSPQDGYTGTCAAIRDADLRADAARIALPVLCVCGSADLSTPPAVVRDMAEMIPGAGFELIDGVGHLPCLEVPELLSGLIDRFIKENSLV